MPTMLNLFTILSSAATSQSSSETPVDPTPSFSWSRVWQTIVDFFTNNALNIAVWFLVLVLGALLIYFIVRFIRFLMKRHEVDEMAIRFVSKIIKFLLWLFLILVLLAMMGIPVGGLTTGISAAILAIGMALKDFLSHLAAGIILIVSKNYKKGDYISIEGGPEGSIVDINFLFTTLKTYDSTRVTVPNSMMVNKSVTNLEALGIRRLPLHFPIAHDSDLNVVRSILIDVMKSDGRVKLDPPPLCRLSDIKPAYLDMFLTCYVDVEDYWDVYYYVYDHGYDELKRAGIRIPYQRVTVYQGEEADELPISHKELPARVEKAKKEDKLYHFNLIDYDEMTPEQVAQIMAHNKKVKAKRKAAKQAAQEAKAQEKKKKSESKEKKGK